jgi:hypothetical protein
MNHNNQLLEMGRIDADENGVDYLEWVINQGGNKIQREEHWPDVKELDCGDALAVAPVDLMNNEHKDILTLWARSMSKTIKFPPSTAFMHGMGVIASAMTKSFSFKVIDRDETPVTLYVVTAQPPSAGKSSINDFFSKPVRQAYAELNANNQPMREMLEEDIEYEIAAYHKISRDDRDARFRQKTLISDMQEKLATMPKYKYSLADTTIEAAESVAGKQGGLFNIISAEAESVNVITGAVYGDSAGKKNVGLILNGWGGEHFSSSRVGRDGYEGFVRGSIAVIAQYDSVDTLLNASSNRGLAERFLLYAEAEYMGSRSFKKDAKYKLDMHLKNEYKKLIDNLVFASKTVFTVPPEAESLIDLYRDKVEPNLGAIGAYSANVITGFAGKADNQILRIASVLHASKHWVDGGNKSTVIEMQTIARAKGIFEDLLKAYINIADVMGHTGTNSETNKMIEKLGGIKNNSRSKGKISIRELVNQVKNIAPFKNARASGLTAHIKTKILPMLQKNNYCYVHKNNIYINPKL